MPSNINIHLIQVLYLCSIYDGATYIIIQCSCTYVLAYSCTMTHYDTQCCVAYSSAVYIQWSPCMDGP